MCVCVCVCARARARACVRTHTRTHTHTEVCRSHGCQVAMVNKFCMVTPNCCESLVHFMAPFWCLESRGGYKIFVKFVQSCIYTVRLQFYVPTFCIFHNFTQLFYGSSQMAIIKMFPGFFCIFRWSPQKCKIGV